MPLVGSDSNGDPDVRAVRAQLRRVLASSEFVGAGRMCRFLEVIVTAALEDRGHTLKEYSIGLAVFDRAPEFNPATDPIVRVEARRLRTKLARYYEGEGRLDQLVIELPKGTYVPRFGVRDGAATASASKTPRNSIAVLPFEAVSDATVTGGQTKSGEQHFADGLTWELIHQLTRVAGLSVVAWSSAEKIRGAHDPKAAGSTLNASTVLLGSVRRAGNRLRIVAQLVDSTSGVYLWSEMFDRTLEDLFEIQDDIARAIVARLKSMLTIAGTVPQNRPAYNIEAYQLYLSGRSEWNSRTEEGLRASIDCFRRAIEIDRNFALGYAGLADAYALLADYGLEPAQDVLPPAKQAAHRALEIDPTLGEAHCSLGFLLALAEWRWQEGEAHLEMSIRLNPGYATAHHWYSVDLLAVLGRFDEALRAIEIARQLDPLSLIIAEGLPYTYLLARRYAEAEECMRSLITANPAFYKFQTTLARILVHTGRYEEAVAHFDEARRLEGEYPSLLAALSQTHAMSGNREEARAVLGRLKAMEQTRHVPYTTMSIPYIGLGEYNTALDLLERAAGQHELALAGLKLHPAYDALRDEPRFKGLLRRLNFGD